MNFEKEFKDALCKVPQNIIEQTQDLDKPSTLWGITPFKEKVAYLFIHRDNIHFLSTINDALSLNFTQLPSYNINSTAVYWHNDIGKVKRLPGDHVHQYRLNNMTLGKGDCGVHTLRMDFQDLELPYPKEVCVKTAVDPTPGGDFFVWEKNKDHLVLSLVHFSHRKSYTSRFRWIDTLEGTIL